MLASPLNAHVGHTRPGPMFGAAAPNRILTAPRPRAAAWSRSWARTRGTSRLARTVFVGACLAVVVLSVSVSIVTRRAASASVSATAVAARPSFVEPATGTRGRPLTQWVRDALDAIRTVPGAAGEN